MKPFALSLAFFLGLVAMASARPFEAFDWSHRPLIVVAPSEAHDFVAVQRAELAGQSFALSDRDMVVVEVLGERVLVDGRPSDVTTADAVREFYAIAPEEFRVFLIGRDTGVKMRSARPFMAGRLFDVIDAMPMRQQEMGRGDG